MPRGLGLHRNLDVIEGIVDVRRGDDDELARLEGTGCLQHPVDHAPAEDQMEVLGRVRTHPGSEATGKNDGCEVAFGHCVQGTCWGARIRTWDRGTKTRCLTTWLRPKKRTAQNISLPRIARR